MEKLNILSPSTIYSQMFDTLKYSEAVCTLGEKALLEEWESSKTWEMNQKDIHIYLHVTSKVVSLIFCLFFPVACFYTAGGRSCR